MIDLSVTKQLTLDQRAMLYRGAFLVDLIEGLVQLGQRNLGQKPQRAQIHAEHRDAGLGHGARRGEQRAVSTQHNHEVKRKGCHLLALSNFGTRAYAAVSPSITTWYSC